ncbi:MAG: alpha/beta hydrolase [Candidatus Daviesbacteria bacterium]|nr:alpha/beta hydrolase [Candidatus Daviesbacteria bacterium]
MSKILVLLTGLNRTKKSYQRLIDQTPKGWEMYVLSYQQLMPNGDIKACEKIISNFLKSHHLKKIYLAGHSLGGGLAIKFASEHPESVEKLYLINSIGVYKKENSIKALSNFLMTHLISKVNLAENIQAIVRILKRPNYHLSLSRFVRTINLENEAKNIKVPTILTWGAKDFIVPLWKGEKLHSLIKNSKLIVLEGMDHDWILHSPELFWNNI